MLRRWGGDQPALAVDGNGVGGTSAFGLAWVDVVLMMKVPLVVVAPLVAVAMVLMLIVAVLTVVVVVVVVVAVAMPVVLRGVQGHHGRRRGSTVQE